MSDPYQEDIIRTPIPDMMAALVAGAFIKANVPIWIKPGDDDRSIKVSYPQTQSQRASDLFNGLKKSAQKIHEKPSSRNGRLLR